ncbi:MAG: DUF1653 domain-containing protein [Asticcacaulis sp.]
MTRPIADYPSAIETGLYRHYKGKDYVVYGSVTHSETEEVLVLYAPVVQTEAGLAEPARLWVRPLAMFTESVDIEGKIVPRFQKL